MNTICHWNRTRALTVRFDSKRSIDLWHYRYFGMCFRNQCISKCYWTKISYWGTLKYQINLLFYSPFFLRYLHIWVRILLPRKQWLLVRVCCVCVFGSGYLLWVWLNASSKEMSPKQIKKPVDMNTKWQSIRLYNTYACININQTHNTATIASNSITCDSDIFCSSVMERARGRE